jgi:uncharacterized protein
VGPVAAGGSGGGGDQGPVLGWPDFNKLIARDFQFHWSYPQLVTVKIGESKSPLTAMSHRREFDIHDETYTFAPESFSRKNAYALTSVDYDKMSAADKARNCR